MENITYSLINGNVTLSDYYATGKLAESYFHTHEHIEEMQISNELAKFIIKNFPESNNIIKNNNIIIGFTFILPCTKEGMNLFMENKITENELTDYIKYSMIHKKYESFYLCAAFIIPEFRNKHIIFEGFKIHVSKLLKYSKNPEFFCWIYSNEGKHLVYKLSKELNIKIIFKS